LILLGVPPLGGCNYITPRRAGLSATAGLSYLYFIMIENQCMLHKNFKDHTNSRFPGVVDTPRHKFILSYQYANSYVWQMSSGCK